jgi:hypothetical protein
MLARGGAVEPTDPNFNQTVLLLHGDGTNGAQNNTFLDSSTNNFTITRNGNTTQGTFSPFSNADGEWSNYFDGNGDYFALSSTALNLGSNNFTVEAWVFTTATTEQCVVGSIQNSNGAGSWMFNLNYNSNKLRFFCKYGGGSTLDYQADSGSFPTNTWTHIAATRDGSNLRMFINGTQVGTTSTTLSTSSIDNAATNYYIGQTTDGASDLSGYISNLRVVTGTAVYTSNFTPPTAPLTAIANTTLLTCQSNRFIDNSASPLTLTVNGNTSVQPFSPFAPSAAYSASVNGGSGYFDGTGDRLSAPNSSAFSLTTEDFTFDFWFYATSTTSFQRLFEYNNGTSSNSNYMWAVRLNGGEVEFANQSGTSGLDVGQAYVPFCWNYVNITRSSTSATVTVNGSSTTGTVYGTSNNPAGAILNIGTRTDGNSPFSGYLSDLRIIKNSATSYSIPTAPLTAVSGTSILLNFTNAGIFDNTAKNNLETVGNAQVDTSVVKYGTGSMKFDGSGDNIVVPDSPNLNFGTGDFTIECWVYFDALSSNRVIAEKWTSGQTGGWQFYWRSTGSSITFYVGSTIILQDPSSGTISTGTWYHIAVARSGSTIKLFIDGSEKDSATFTTSLDNTSRFNLGSQITTNTNYLDGYIDDLRITKGVARYTTDFTPPGGPFLNK